jgi:hypothetical protein
MNAMTTLLGSVKGGEMVDAATNCQRLKKGSVASSCFFDFQFG